MEVYGYAPIPEEVRDRYNRTPLHVAAAKDSVEILESLFKRGINVNTIGGKDNMTPLHMAARGNCLNALKWLVDKEADLDILNSHGRTPMEEAIHSSSHYAAEYLLKVVVQKRQEKFIEEHSFGKKKWEHFFGDIGIEPPLPDNIWKILNAPCPIWPGKKVYETHLLTLIPQTVNGQPLTLKKLGELVKNPLHGNATMYTNFSIEVEDRPNPNSHWTLLSRDLIPNSRNKSYAEQQNLVEQYPGYEVPNALDTAVALFMEHVQSGTRLYPAESRTLTRCQEKYDLSSQLVIGGFAVVFASNNRKHFRYGVGVQRKFC